MEHFLEDGLCYITAVTADKQLVLPAYGLGRVLQVPLQVTLSIRELACSNSVVFPMRCGEGSKPVTVLI